MSAFRIVALWCWYRGEHFHGYQRQQSLRTVQDELLKAFAGAGLARNPVVAGRTDKGVSARMQVLSGRLEKDVTAEVVVSRLNAQLPSDLGIHLARDVEPGFHAAWSASSKEYRYALGPQEVGDLALLKQAAALIPGTRNFKVFHFKSSEQKDRTVSSVEVLPVHAGSPADPSMGSAHRLRPGPTLRFVGEGFARHMVRMLVGGMTAVSQRRIGLEVFREGLLNQKNFHCPTAAPEPLTLWNVGYPAQVDPFTSAERSAFCLPSP